MLPSMIRNQRKALPESGVSPEDPFAQSIARSYRRRSNKVLADLVGKRETVLRMKPILEGITVREEVLIANFAIGHSGCGATGKKVSL
jgi:hypothetical protein